MNISNKFFQKKEAPVQKTIEYKINHFLEQKENNEKPYIKIHYKDFNVSFDEYRDLTRNLDEKSIITISRMINRIKLIQEDETIKYKDILSDEELLSVKKLQYEFYDAIMEFDNGLWTYKNYVLPVKGFTNSVFYFNHCMDENLNYNYFKNKDIIDLGAYIGDSAIVLSKYTNKNVLSFEGSPVNFEILKKTIALNNVKNVIPVNYAVSDEAKTVYFTPNYSSAAHIISDEIQNKEDYTAINTITLDEYIEKNNIKAGLIKVDIEGAEQSFLRGAKETIKKQKPTLLLSIYHNASDLIHIKPMIESWDLGYKFRIKKSYDGCIFGETMLICEV